MMQKYVGADITSMVTLPVLIFEPMTMLQKMAELMKYSHLLELADKCEDPHMRMVYAEYATEQGGISADVIKKAFSATEEKFFQFVKHQLPIRPHIASVGSCCLVGAISDIIRHIITVDSCT